MRIAFQGEPGAYSEAAALASDASADPVPCRSFEDVFTRVSDGSVDRGILPMENSIGGSIHRNYDLMVEHDLPIVGEVELKVEHCLLSLPGTRREDIRVVHSHPQALAQCERFLQALTGVEITAVYDTAGGAKLVRDQQRRDTAAIASKRAADVFGLEILQEGIQDFDANITRFAVIGREPDVRQADKTSIVFALPNEPGALVRALSLFAARAIDLAKLESRPIRGRPWEYMFYADLASPQQDLACARALVDLGAFARWVRVLGTYRSWHEPVPGEASASHSVRP